MQHRAVKRTAIDDARAGIEQRLTLATQDCAGPLGEAMRHLLLAKAKRARGLLVLVSAAHHGAEGAGLAGAAAVEMAHAASLILDDLPAMDDAQTRRGCAATHRLFGEATAILAAIALLSRAFAALVEEPALQPAARAESGRVLAAAIGPAGMVGGQALDIAWDGVADAALVEAVHDGKTASLFAASAELGAIAAGADAVARARAAACGRSLGLALQALDDVLDATGDSVRAGKTTGQDRERRPSLVAAVGLTAADAVAAEHLARAKREAGSGPLAIYCDDLAGLLRQAVDTARYPGDMRVGGAR